MPLDPADAHAVVAAYLLRCVSQKCELPCPAKYLEYVSPKRLISLCGLLGYHCTIYTPTPGGIQPTYTSLPTAPEAAGIHVLYSNLRPEAAFDPNQLCNHFHPLTLCGRPPPSTLNQVGTITECGGHWVDFLEAGHLLTW